MDGKTALITGGAKGIGWAIAETMAMRGAHVALVDLDRAALDGAVDALEAAGHRATGVQASVTRRADCHRAFDDATDALGGIDILVNNAGIYVRTPIEEITDDDWDLIFDVCLRGLFHMSVAAVRHMRTRGGGRIVNIASVDGFVPFPGMAHYAAAKAGVISLTRSFGLAYVKDGILVNGVAPGATDTEPMRQGGYLDRLVPSLPIGRGAAPAEIAEAVCFLAGDTNSYCVGETMVVSGGLVFA